MSVMAGLGSGEKEASVFINSLFSLLSLNKAPYMYGDYMVRGKSPLRLLTQNVTGATYCETLNSFLQINNLPLNWILMDYNARPHRATIVAEFKVRRGIRSLSSWPPYSPDLNPIENAWDCLSRRVQDRCKKLAAIGSDAAERVG